MGPPPPPPPPHAFPHMMASVPSGGYDDSPPQQWQQAAQRTFLAGRAPGLSAHESANGGGGTFSYAQVWFVTFSCLQCARPPVSLVIPSDCCAGATRDFVSFALLNPRDSAAVRLCVNTRSLCRWQLWHRIVLTHACNPL